MSKVQLNFEIIGPDTDEYDRVEVANNEVSRLIDDAFSDRSIKLHWCYGDSSDWRVIIAIPTEKDLSELEAASGNDELAREVFGLIESVVDLNEGFKLHMELDSDERVESNEGWFLRLKSFPKRERTFVWNGEKLTRA